MSLALFPLGLISMYQMRAVVLEAQKITNAALASKTVAAAAAERELIQEAIGAAQALASAIALGAENCDRLLAAFVAAQERYISAGFTAANGGPRCASGESAPEYFSQSALLAALNRDGPTISISEERGSTPPQSVVLVSHPARLDGSAIGLVTLSIPHGIENPLLLSSARDELGLRMASVNADGVLVSASESLAHAEGFLPVGIGTEELFARAGSRFRAEAGDGRDRIFIVTPMIEDQLVLVGSWPTTAPALSSISLAQGTAFILPILMWFAGMAVAYFGLQRLVIRHVRALRSAMGRFASGDRLSSARLDLDDPPEELEEAEQAFNRMASLVAEAEARQLQDLAEREVFLKEIHHRVKKNLQLIAYIMNMQSRQAKSSETQTMLASLQRRVRGLAMLHRTLYDTAEMTTVDAADLIKLIVRESASLALQKDISIRTRLDPVELYPDQAAPLSMLVSEAMTNAFKHIGKPATGPAWVDVTLTPLSDSMLEIVVANSVGENLSGALPQDDETTSGLGRRLMAAFATQLDGEEQIQVNEDRYVLTLKIPRRSSTVARNAAAE